MFFHTRIVLKPEHAKETAQIAFETDLTHENLISKIARPFAEGKQFFCGGVIVHPSKVQEVRFSRTQQTSGELLPFIRARRRSSGVLTVHPPEWDVIWDGDDATREILDEASSPEKTANLTSRSVSDRVFIVHGHDIQALDQTELLIRRFGLTPIILRDSPSGGRTLIEKIEAYSDVGCAIVLLTPDDVGGIDGSHLLPRARQNAIWEWGYLVAKLGRKQVICLYKAGVEMPSDLHGLVTIHVTDDVRDKADEIKRELKAGGYDVA